ncbi:MAG: transporter suffix domain-containing protein [Methanothrix sp.]
MKRDIQSLKRCLGIALVVLSFAFYGCLLLVPLSSFSGERKIALSTLLVILGEGSFWLAVIILGREAIAKYRSFDWRNWLSGWLKKP